MLVSSLAKVNVEQFYIQYAKKKANIKQGSLVYIFINGIKFLS